MAQPMPPPTSSTAAASNAGSFALATAALFASSSQSAAMPLPSGDATCRIAVIGDEGVGKTSLIAAAATETFPDHPPPVLPPARLPADTTPEGVPVVITDSSSRPEDRAALELACQEASVIVLCFSMDKPATLRRVQTHWMPELRRLGVHAPVMLVGCKSDVRPADPSLHQAVLPIVRQHPQIETCMECSAKKLQFVGEVFYYALKAVIHPMAPLYDPEAQALKPLCARALKRIFLLCDADKDGILNDTELNAFQVYCFNAPLQSEELVGVKQVVSQKIPAGIINDGLSLPGFLFLHALFIERGRLETTWAVLRRFGYGNDLRLSDDVLSKAPLPHAADQVVELTEAGRSFFETAFRRFDNDGDDALSPRERDEMFSTAPADPWSGAEHEGLLVETTRKGLLTLQGYLASWAWTTAEDPKASLAHALYLGYPDDAPAERLFSLSRPRRAERRGDEKRRSVLRGAVFPAPGVDAAPLLEGLIAQARPAHGVPAGPVTAAAAAVASGEAEGAPTTLLLRSFAEPAAAALLAAPDARERLAACDVAAFVFDGQRPESFRAAVAAMAAVASASGDVLPCLLVAANDQDMTPALAAEVGEACSALAVRPPAPLPAKPGSPALYQALVGAAWSAELAIPETPSLKAARQYRRFLRRALVSVGVGTTAVLAGLLAWRLLKGSGSKGAETAGSGGSSSGAGGSSSSVVGGGGGGSEAAAGGATAASQ